MSDITREEVIEGVKAVLGCFMLIGAVAGFLVLAFSL